MFPGSVSKAKSSLKSAFIGTVGFRFIGLANSMVSEKKASIGTVGVRMRHSGQKMLPGSLDATISPIVLALRVDN